MLLFTTTIQLKNKAKADIESKWEMTDLRILTKIVGIELTITNDAISISSNQYIKNILNKERMAQLNSVSTPLDHNVPIIPNPEGNIRDRSNAYIQLLGELQYVANAMCLDITYAVNRLASYTANPSLQHQTALKRILRYLSGTSDYCIIYKALPEQSDFFHGYANAAYANTDENRSTTGYVFLAGEGAITWSSKQQISMALSSTEAEYIALRGWMQGMLVEELIYRIGSS